MILKLDGRIIDFTKFKSRRIQKVDTIFFSPTAFSLFIAHGVPFYVFRHKVCSPWLPVPYLKIHSDFPVVGLIFSDQSFLKAEPKLGPKTSDAV